MPRQHLEAFLAECTKLKVKPTKISMYSEPYLTIKKLVSYFIDKKGLAMKGNK